MKKIIRILLILLIAAGLLAGGRALVKHKQAALRKSPRYGMRPVPVQAATAATGSLPVRIAYLAVAEPANAANISSRVTAAIERVLCDEGDPVKKGQTLITLDRRETRKAIQAVASQIAEARAELSANEAAIKSLAASLAYWRREAERDRVLAEKKDIPGSRAEGTADRANEYQGKLAAAKDKSRALRHLIDSLGHRKAGTGTRLTYYTLKSPYDGIVTRRLADPGDLAAPGKTLLVVEDRSRVKLAFDIPQQDLDRIREGLPVTYAGDGKGRKARLSHIYPALNTARMLRAEVYLDPEEAKGISFGQYVPLSVITREIRNVTILPNSAIIENPGRKPYVFVIKDGRLTARPVTLLASSGDDVAVRGVRAGERVVTSTFLGWANLSAGIRVEVRE